MAVACVGECSTILFDDRHADMVGTALAEISLCMQPGGLLLFDVAEPGRVPGGSRHSSFEKAMTGQCSSWRMRSRTGDLNAPDHTTFRKVGEFYRRDHECHRQRLLPRLQLLAWLAELGFTVQVLESYGALVLPPSYVGFLSEKNRVIVLACRVLPR